MFRRWRRNRQLGKIKPGNGSALQPFRWYQLFGRSVFFIDLQERDGEHTYAIDARYFQDELSGQKGDPSWTGEDEESAEDGEGRSFGAVLNDWLGGDESRTGLGDLLGLGGDDDIFGTGSSASTEPDRVGHQTRSNETDATGAESGIPSEPNDLKPGKAPAALYRDGVQLYRSKLPATFPVPGGVIEVAASGYGASRMHFVDEQGGEQVLVPHRRAAEGLRARFGQRFPGFSRTIGVLAIITLLVGLTVGIPQGIEMITSIEPIAERFGTFTSPIQLPDWANITLFVAGLLAATERALTLRNNWLIDFDTTWTALG